MLQLRFLIEGRVQGVGYRYFCRDRALQLGIKGYAKNLPDGRVEVIAEGNEGQLAQLESALREGPSFGRVDTLLKTVSEIGSSAYADFSIR
jgi:acylphosphatase